MKQSKIIVEQKIYICKQWPGSCSTQNGSDLVKWFVKIYCKFILLKICLKTHGRQ